MKFMVSCPLAISLFLFGTWIHQLAEVNKISTSKSAEQPKDTIFSGLHTLKKYLLIGNNINDNRPVIKTFQAL